MKIAITGANGKVGQALIGQLDPELFEVTPLDLPNHDATDYDDLVAATAGHDALIHFAWRDLNTKHVHPDNRMMYENAYRAAIANGIGLVIMGSSNHARKHSQLEDDGRVRYTGAPEEPNNPYGAEKQRMEALGKDRADTHGLRVVALRIGSVNAADKPNADTPTRWMSHRDFGNLITLALRADFEPGHFEVVYGVSEQEVFDPKNEFGYVPQDVAVATTGE